MQLVVSLDKFTILAVPKYCRKSRQRVCVLFLSILFLSHRLLFELFAKVWCLFVAFVFAVISFLRNCFCQAYQNKPLWLSGKCPNFRLLQCMYPLHYIIFISFSLFIFLVFFLTAFDLNNCN